MENHEAEKIESIDVSIAMPWGHVAGRWYGNRRVRPLLALHGWLDNMGTWNNLLPLLPKHLGVLCIDLPGHGRSSKLPQGIIYDDMGFVRVIAKIMKAYNWKRVSMLSHSLSARLAFVFAALYPQKVDLIIAIDIVGLRYFPPDHFIPMIRERFERTLIENDRLVDDHQSEPPSLPFEVLERKLREGSGWSVELENCKYILERNIMKSKLYPQKYYFSRDGRVKHMFDLMINPGFALELARRVRNVPYCLIKASESVYINENSEAVIAVLRANNPGFEFHEVTGSHHVHLNNAAGVAEVINSFICRHRPPLLDSWTMDTGSSEEDVRPNDRLKAKCKL